MNTLKNKHHGLVSRVLTFVLFICPAYMCAQTTFPACDGRLYYFSENATSIKLNYIDQYSTTNVISTTVCTLPSTVSLKVNALGANPVDKFLYFIEKDDVNGDVVIRKLRNNCTTPIVCPANNNPTIPFAKSGCFDTLGRYWIVDGTQLTAWDLNTCKIVKGPYTLTDASNDIVFNPWDCCLYTGGNKIDLNGNITTITGAKLNGPGLAMGLDGRVYAIQGGSTDSMELNRYDITTGIKSTVGFIKPGSANGSDMASIPCAILTANFIASPPACPPSTINFTDKSTGLITQWNWNFGDGSTSTLQSPSHTFSSSGTYTVSLTVSTTNSCIVVAPSTYTLSITVPSGPIVTVNSATICSGKPATLTAGGATTYTWAPSTGLSGSTGTAVTASPTATTTYTITGTTAGCTHTSTAVVTVNPNPVVSIAPVAAICTGASTTLTASGADTYTWTPGTGLSTTTGTSVTASPAATTTYTVTGSNPTGCTGTSTVVVTITPTTITVPAAVICQGNSATLTASGGSTYTWAPATGLSATTGATVTANPSSTTTYTVTGTTAGGCTGTTTVIVTVNPPCGTSVNVTGTTICEGACGTITATATGGAVPYTYLWNTGNTGSSLTACPVTTTSYTVTVTDNSGLTATNSTSIIVNPLTTLNAAGIDVTCNGACNGQVIVIPSAGMPPYTYNWSSGCTDAACNNICPGTYTITTTDAVGCTASATATVTEPTILTAVTGQTHVSCFGLCDGTASVSANGGTAPYTYSWNSTPVQTGTTATGLCAGTFTCTVTDANNCSVNTSVTITQPAVVSVTSADANICPNTCTTLNASGSGGTGTILYNWSLGVTTAAVSVCPAATSTYTVTGTDANGCSAVTTVIVALQPEPIVTVPPATICQGTITTLTASGANTYSWTPVTGLSAGTGTTVTANPVVTTTYTVTGTSTFGCTGSTTVIVTVNTAPTITPNPASVCPGDSVALTASGAVTYTWSPAWGLSSTTGAVVIVKPTATSAYTITGTGTNGCTSSTLVTVTVHPKPVATFSTSPDPVTLFNPTVYFTDHSDGAITWNWSLGDVNNSASSDQDPVFTYPDTGRYVIRLIVTNQFGCIDTTESTLLIKGEYTFFIPNTFTPNGDGTNDGFAPKGTGIDETDYDLWIFDRWGNLIWHTDIWGEQWDGRANGGADVAQIDTYVWKVHVKEKDLQVNHDYIGHVNIVK